MHLVKPRPYPPPPTDIRYMYWERKFPGKGRDFFELTLPFYSWRPMLVPKIEQNATPVEMIAFWANVKQFRYVSGKNAETFSVMHRSLSQSLGDALWSKLQDALKQTFEDRHAWDVEREKLWRALRESLRTSLGETDNDELLSEIDDLPRAILLNGLWDSFFFPCAFIVANRTDEAMKFKPLLGQWLTGNFPIGVDQTGRLVCLTA